MVYVHSRKQHADSKRYTAVTTGTNGTSLIDGAAESSSETGSDNGTVIYAGNPHTPLHGCTTRRLEKRYIKARRYHMSIRQEVSQHHEVPPVESTGGTTDIGGTTCRYDRWYHRYWRYHLSNRRVVPPVSVVPPVDTTGGTS